MFKKILGSFFAGLMILSIAVPSSAAIADTVSADDNVQNQETVDNENVEVIEDSEEGTIVRKYDDLTQVNVSKWGKWQYTNIAVSTGVLANAINKAMGGGVTAVAAPVAALVGIPTWAIAALLEGASWTDLGSKPGKAVVNTWDKNGNGWVGFYMRKGYNGSTPVATDYKTK
ncbi:hypothetical protein WN867_11560 [Tetragenococcus halophilus]|uniref:hypothetical protein n=1 Tax=Tetragenococcus halophilus TaxID=51669 RepID=UPI0030C921BA